MSESNKAMCPLFPDTPCPQGHGSADVCKVRMEGDLNPLENFRDYLFINCALQRAKENEQKNKISSKPKD
jgi:hypothetical protein